MSSADFTRANRAASGCGAARWSLDGSSHSSRKSSGHARPQPPLRAMPSHVTPSRATVRAIARMRPASVIMRVTTADTQYVPPQKSRCSRVKLSPRVRPRASSIAAIAPASSTRTQSPGRKRDGRPAPARSAKRSGARHSARRTARAVPNGNAYRYIVFSN